MADVLENLTRLSSAEIEWSRLLAIRSSRRCDSCGYMNARVLLAAALLQVSLRFQKLQVGVTMVGQLRDFFEKVDALGVSMDSKALQGVQLQLSAPERTSGCEAASSPTLASLHAARRLCVYVFRRPTVDLRIRRCCAAWSYQGWRRCGSTTRCQEQEACSLKLLRAGRWHRY